MPPELTYEDDEELQPQRRPKWTLATLPLEKEILDAVGRTYYQAHDERNTVRLIVKAAMPIADVPQGKYPIEWVRFCIEWAKKKRREHKPINLLGLVHFIQNDDRRREWVDRWIKEHPDAIRPQQFDEGDVSPRKGGFFDG